MREAGSDRWGPRWWALWGLARLAPESAKPALIAALKDPDDSCSQIAGWGLVRIGDKMIIPLLLAAADGAPKKRVADRFRILARDLRAK